MKGRKKDAEFVSQFISRCVQEGRQTAAEIVQAAKDRLASIDRVILGAEKVKKERPQLLDVIASFETDRKDHSSDKSVLSFYRLKHPNDCRFLARSISAGGFIPDYLTVNMSNEEKFATKQMLEQDIIKRNENSDLVASSRFEEYLSFLVMCE